MTKRDLVEEVARVMETSRKEARIIVELVLDCIVRGLRENDKVEIRGFGSFHTRHKPGRIGRNPKTGGRVTVPPKRIAFFKASKEVRELLERLASEGATRA